MLPPARRMPSLWSKAQTRPRALDTPTALRPTLSDLCLPLTSRGTVGPWVCSCTPLSYSSFSVKLGEGRNCCRDRIVMQGQGLERLLAGSS